MSYTYLITCTPYPSRDVWFEFSKLAISKLNWFGVWDSDNELNLLRYHCFSSISLDDMNGQVKLWGPVPIIALTKPQSFSEADFKAW